MKAKFILSVALTGFCSVMVLAQTQLSQDLKLDGEIRSTGIIHSPLPLDFSKSLEALAEKKEVLNSEPFSEFDESLTKWSHTGVGTMSFTKEKSVSGKGSLKVEYPPISEDGIKSFVDYEINGANWEKYNRISFWVYPDCEGARSMHMSLLLHNDGKVKIPDEYNR